MSDSAERLNRAAARLSALEEQNHNAISSSRPTGTTPQRPLITAPAGDTDGLVPADAPEEIKRRVLQPSRTPVNDPTLGIRVEPGGKGQPRHRFVAIGDSLTHGFQSGAVFNTDLSYPAIVAHELGWLESFNYPKYEGLGGMPLNIEY